MRDRTTDAHQAGANPPGSLKRLGAVFTSAALVSGLTMVGSAPA
ncbi:hypothetical protein [Nesterenkonia massiliensis]|nr:hypothetical protein [Nesterenkonia massiliensis]